MNFIRPILWRFHGDELAGKKYMGRGSELMRSLEWQMEQSRFGKHYKQDVLRVRPAPGVTIEAKKFFDLRIVHITVERVGEQGRRKETFKLVKIFVHVDMLNSTPGVLPPSDDWVQYYKTDEHSSVYDWEPEWNLTRGMVTSAVVCGLVNLADGTIFWSNVKTPTRVPTGEGLDTSTEWLACHRPLGSPWDGIFGHTTYSTPQAVLEFYNNLFPLAPYRDVEVPNITTSDIWLDRESHDHDGIEEGLSAHPYSYTMIDGTLQVETWKMSVPIPGWGFDATVRGTALYYQIVDKNDWSYFAPHRWSVKSLLYEERIWNHETTAEGTYKLTAGTSPYTILYTSVSRHRYNPIVGTVWDFNSWIYPPVKYTSYTPDWECQMWVDEGGTIVWYNWPQAIELYFLWQILPLRMDQGEMLEDTEYPIVPRNMYPWRFYTNGWDWNDGDYFQYSDIDPLQNYKTADGFCWYSGFAGGLVMYDVMERYPVCSPEPVDYDITWRETKLRTMVNFGVATGKNIIPFRDRTNSPIAAAIKELCGEAITFLGGSVYANIDIPYGMDIDNLAAGQQMTIPTPLRADFLAHAGINNSTNFWELPGLIYCSPCYAIKVYGVPVKATVEIEI